MNGNRNASGSNLNKVDSHKISAADYDDIPELSDEWFERADQYEGETLKRRGRPRKESPKVLMSVRYSPDVVERFRATGEGWQTRMDEALKDWLSTHDPANL